MNSDTLPLAELLDWLEGRLPPKEAQTVAERLNTAGEATQADLDWLRAFLAASQSVRLSSPPASVRDTLRRRFAARTEAREPPGFFQRWIAALTFDSRLQPATPGLRSAAVEGQQRQLIYSAEALEIALNWQPDPNGRQITISGQVFPTGAAPAHEFSLQVLQDGAEVALATPDELGEFAFTALPVGDYELVIGAAQFEVVIPSLHLRP